MRGRSLPPSRKQGEVETERAQSLTTLKELRQRLERCDEIVKKVGKLGLKMKRTPVLKPGQGGAESIPPLAIEPSRSDSDGQASVGGNRTRSQGRRPPISPNVEEKGKHNLAGMEEIITISQEDVGDIPQLSREELVREIPQERKEKLKGKDVMVSWQVLAEELDISKKEVDKILEVARKVVDGRLITYEVQLFKVVVSMMLRRAGEGSLVTNHHRVEQEVRRAVNYGDLSEEEVTQAKELKGKGNIEGGQTNRNRTKNEKEETKQYERKGKSDDSEDQDKEVKKKDKKKDSKEGKKSCRLRTQLGGLYSSDSESGSSSESSRTSRGSRKKKERRGRRRDRDDETSTERSTSSDLSPRREKQRRDKEYLQAVRATRPGKYNGDTQKPQALVSWITQMTQYFSLMNLSRRDEVRIAISYLEEEAATWWSQVPRHRKERIKSWRNFKEYVVREFLPHDYNLALWRKLDMTYQKTSVAEYVARFHEIQRQLFDLPRKVAKTKLLNGLKPTIRGHVLALRPRTQREVIRLARNFDEAFFAKAGGNISERTQWNNNRTFNNRVAGRLNNIESDQAEVNMATDRNTGPQRKEFKKPIGKDSVGPEKKQFKCFNCGKMGHMARECWAPRKPFNRASKGAPTRWRAQEAPEEEREKKEVIATIAVARVVNPPRSAKLTVYWGHVQGHKAEILVDSGASTVFLSEAFIRKYRIRTCKRPVPITIEFAGKTEQVSTRMVPNASLALGKYEEEISFEIAVAAYNVILGKAWLDEHQAEIVTNSHELFFSYKGRKHVIGKEALVGRTEVINGEANMMQNNETKILMVGGKVLKKLVQTDHGHVFAVRVMEKQEKEEEKVQVPVQHREKVMALMGRYKDTFQEAIPITPEEQIHGVKHDIIIEAGSVPTVAPMYRLSTTELKELKEKVEDLLKRGHIRPSSSPYAAGVLFVPKKGGALRMCIDYRQLNKVTVKNRYPLPLIDELLEKLEAARVFSKMDLTDGYHHIPVKEEDRHRTAFRTPMGLFEYTVMPFGLANAPATFQRFMNDLFRDMTEECLVVYMDDLLVHSRTMEEHEEHLAKVLKRLKEKKLCVKLSKSQFFQSKVEFLGYIVGQGAVAPDPEKVKAIVEWPSPLPSVTAVRSFLGLAQFYKRFIPQFSEKAAPLTNLTKGERAFEWTEAEQKAFDTLKESLVELPKVYLPRMEEPFKMRVQTDASGFAVGAVLHQLDADGNEVPVAYASRKLEQRELGRPVHEKEFIAIHFALTKWRHLLLGREFAVFTDHHSLQFFMTQKKLDARFARMAGFLAQFDLKINYKPGKENTVPDALSRRHDYEVVNAIKTTITDEVSKKWIKRIRETPYGNEYKELIQVCGEDHKIRRGRCWFQLEQGVLWVEKEGKWKMVVPKELRIEVMQTAHQGAVGACQGFLKTYAAIRKAFFWGGMFVDVLQHIRKCSSCAQIKDATTAMRAPLCSIPPAEERWQQISMDFISDLPETEAGKDTILTVIDSLTKLAHFIPCKKTDSAREIAITFRREIWRHHGLPKITISDRDTRFICDFWKALNELLGIQVRLSSAFHPETDGQSERVNRTIEQILRYYCSAQQEKWDEFIEMAEFAYNSSQHSVTGMTPFLAAYGYNPTMDLPDLHNQRNRTPAEQIEFMNTAKGILRDAILRVQQHQKRQADRMGRRQRQFAVGDWVWLNTSNLNMRTLQKKLAPRYVGPMQIVKKISEVAFQVKTPERWRIHNVFYIGLLKEYEGDTPEEENKKIPVLTAGYSRRS